MFSFASGRVRWCCKHQLGSKNHKQDQNRNKAGRTQHLDQTELTTLCGEENEMLFSSFKVMTCYYEWHLSANHQLLFFSVTSVHRLEKAKLYLLIPTLYYHECSKHPCNNLCDFRCNAE